MVTIQTVTKIMALQAVIQTASALDSIVKLVNAQDRDLNAGFTARDTES